MIPIAMGEIGPFTSGPGSQIWGSLSLMPASIPSASLPRGCPFRRLQRDFHYNRINSQDRGLWSDRRSDRTVAESL